MSDFEVLTYKAIIKPHGNADNLELAQINDYECIVGKGQYKDGDTVAYIPEGSIVPAAMLEEMGLTGRLSGPDKNRVKAIRLRGVLSQGLVYPMPDTPVGTDVTDVLGITKYVPRIPENMKGLVEMRRKATGQQATFHYFIENIKKYPNMFRNSERVVITEKIHGTWCDIGFIDGEPLASSLGLSKKNQALKFCEENEKRNLYVMNWYKHRDLLERMKVLFGGRDFHVMGEIFGPGVQDMMYGQREPQFMVFDIVADGKFLPWDEVQKLGWRTVPTLYTGPFSRTVVDELTDGKSTIYGADHIREGVVIKPENPLTVEPHFQRRPCLKSISEAYLLRKGGTELT